MQRSRFVMLGAFLVAVVCSLPGIALRMAERLSEAIWSGFAAVVRMVAFQPAFAVAGRSAVQGSIARYREPEQSVLRHESRVHKRSAARHF